jgi:hypothetical protein
MNYLTGKHKYKQSNRFGLFKNNNGFYFDNLEKAIDLVHYGSFIIDIYDQNNIQILVIDNNLQNIIRTYEYINQKPTNLIINDIIIKNSCDYIFMIWLNLDFQIQSKILYEP